MKFSLIFLLWCSVATAQIGAPPAPSSTAAPGAPPTDNSFLGLFPQLKNYVYEEPPSGFFFGLGAAPIGILHDRLMFSGNFFELHWIRDRYDIEVLNASYGLTKAQTSEFQSTHFTFRAAPKYRFFGVISGGPLLGYELVSFPEVGARIYRAPFIQPQSEPFSSRGWIYGVEFSETWNYGKSLFKVTEVAYQETYSATNTDHGWTYIFDDANLQTNNSDIAPSTVLMVEFSFLF